MAAKQDYRIAVLKYMFDDPFGDNYRPSVIWHADMVRDIFTTSNGYSVRDYWMRSTLNMLRPSFEFPNHAWLRLGRSHAELRNDRAKIAAAVRERAANDGFNLNGFDGVIAFMNPPELNAGTQGNDTTVLAQDALMPYYLHEVGHLLGFQDAFGVIMADDDKTGHMYNDKWDVMGDQWPKMEVVQPFAGWEHAELIKGPDFWSNTVPPCAAHVWRRFWNTQVFESQGRVARIRRGERRWIRSWTTAHGSVLQDPLLVVAQDGDDGPTVTVELRLPFWADRPGWTAASTRGVALIHSFRYRRLEPHQTQTYPSWHEGTLLMETGASFSTQDGDRWKITVTGVDLRDGDTRAEILVE
ncbi:hypothetical protein [Agromyces humi]|uniref:hypothetical protein n=1 Tax=Agromyces humi TaxID=1766800 RepID=UPI0013567AEB|nr:hypothetical protein [Agromyces humi]